jgi:hypothetical protein
MATRITMEELWKECIYDMRHYPALCSEGCQVEPHGHCPHGNPSFELEAI